MPADYPGDSHSDSTGNLITTAGPSALRPAPTSSYPDGPRQIVERELVKAEKSLAEPYRGISIGGPVRDGLASVEQTGVSTAQLVAVASALVESLSPSQQDAVTFPVDDDRHWRSWHNMHFCLLRHGLALSELSADQQSKAMDIVRTSMSTYGYTNAVDVMRLNGYAAELTGRYGEYGSDYYWISLFGRPSSTDPWGWQLDGHHLSVNCFVLGDQIVMTPDFRGSEPVEATSGPLKGTRVFAREEAAGLDLMQSLDRGQRATATIAEDPPRELVATAQIDNLSLGEDGLLFDALGRGQQEALVDLISLYTGRLRPGHAEVRLADVKRHLSETRFAWMGSSDDDSAFYYRVASPVILIEFDHLPGIIYDNREPTRRHVHTIVRTPNGNDYGRSLLLEHYRRHDHVDVDSAHRRAGGAHGDT